MFSLVAANTGDTALDFYVSSARCAKAKAGRDAAKGKKSKAEAPAS